MNSMAITVLDGHVAATCLTYSRRFSTAFMRRILKVHGSNLGSKKRSNEYFGFFSSSLPGIYWERIPKYPKATQSLRPLRYVIRSFTVF